MFRHILLLASLAATAHSSGEWCYVDPACGPETWPHHYPECGGNNQSPINIDTSELNTHFQLGPIEIIGSKNFSLGEITNNGHTIEVTLKQQYRLRIGLDDTYALAGFHLHFGSKDSYNFGSEHTINRQSFPLEVHSVFYNLKYANLSEAKSHEDGLVVVGKLFKLGHPNPVLDPIIHELPKLINKGENSSISFNFLKLVPSNLTKYYKYKGSLTTPPCSESVTWIIMADMQSLDKAQYNKIASSVYYTDAGSFEQIYMTDNFRPIQLTNGRIVYKNVK
ncbi:carbonic anhydrase 1-like [Discoglossus pictus]